MAYIGFKKLRAKIAAGGGARNPGAVAAAIGRKKYGKARFQQAAAAGKKMRGMKRAGGIAERMRKIKPSGAEQGEPSRPAPPKMSMEDMMTHIRRRRGG